jgi:hypothetical protein
MGRNCAPQLSIRSDLLHFKIAEAAMHNYQAHFGLRKSPSARHAGFACMRLRGLVERGHRYNETLECV